jgi:molybdopterin converting factor small subunit
MARVELHIYPPLSYRISANRAGKLILEQEIGRGETLGDVLARLVKCDHEAWRDIFDVQTRQIKPAVIIILNGKHLSHSVAIQTPLADGDRISLNFVLAGG